MPHKGGYNIGGDLVKQHPYMLYLENDAEAYVYDLFMSYGPELPPNLEVSGWIDDAWKTLKAAHFQELSRRLEDKREEQIEKARDASATKRNHRI